MSHGQNFGSDTYAFRSTELCAMAAMIYQCISNDVSRLPEIMQTETFPYRSAEGEFTLVTLYIVRGLIFWMYNLGQACFVCEDDSIHCPRVGPGRVEAIFSGPDPGPQGWATLSLALALGRLDPGPVGSGQGQARANPGPLRC